MTETIHEELRRRKTDRAKDEAVFCVNCRHYGGTVYYVYGGMSVSLENGCMVHALIEGHLNYVTGETNEQTTNVRNCETWNRLGDCRQYEAKESK